MKVLNAQLPAPTPVMLPVLDVNVKAVQPGELSHSAKQSLKPLLTPTFVVVAMLPKVLNKVSQLMHSIK